MTVSEGRPVDVAVIGGGIIGTAAALELTRGGASVALFEATAIGAGASGRNSGSVQHPFDQVLAPLHRATLERYRRLAEEAPDWFAFPTAPAGLLLLAPESDRALLEAEQAVIRTSAPELDPEPFNSADILRLEPMLASDLAAVRLQTGFPIPPAGAVRAFSRLAHREGAQLEIGAAVSLDRGGSARSVAVRIADGRRVSAGSVLVAAGPWSPDIADPTGRWRPIVRTWGVTVATRLPRPPGHVLEQVGVTSVNRLDSAERGADPEAHFESTFSLVTAAGVSVVGSTFLPEEPDPDSVGRLLMHRADRFVPGLRAAQVDEVRACARPQSVDGRPLVGRLPDEENVFIAAGHGPWGISTGPATARLVAELILGRPVAIPAELDPARFA